MIVLLFLTVQIFQNLHLVQVMVDVRVVKVRLYFIVFFSHFIFFFNFFSIF